MRQAIALATAMLSACAPASAPGPSSATAANAAWFEEVASARGLTFVHASSHRDRFLLPEIMGGGVALFDMDGDGDLDALLIQSGDLADATTRPQGHRLFRNRGDGSFENASTGSGIDVPGYGMGVATGDYDNDGDTDLYVTNVGANVLLQNDGTGRFRDVTASAGVAGSGWSASATFLDYDGDGWLDLFVARYIDWSASAERACYSLTGVPDYCAPRNYDAPSASLLFRNNGNGSFSDVSTATGIASAVGNGLGVVAADFNADGRIDIFVANDATPNHLWINQGNGRFANDALMSGVAVDQDGSAKAGMGVHAADVDADADEDLLVVNLDSESDSFFRNEGRFFVDATAASGLRTASRRFTRFGMALLDFDNDGHLDLYEANGRVGLQSERFAPDPYAEPNLLMRGVAGGRFEESRPPAGTAASLIATSRGAAFGDIDNDGGIDILIANRDAAPHLLHNVVPRRGHWMTFRVLDQHGRDALGAQLLISSGNRKVRSTVRAGYSYLASNDPRVHVGLGADTKVATVDVTWPDGQRERFGPYDGDGVITLRRRVSPAR